MRDWMARGIGMVALLVAGVSLWLGICLTGRIVDFWEWAEAVNIWINQISEVL